MSRFDYYQEDTILALYYILVYAGLGYDHDKGEEE